MNKRIIALLLCCALLLSGCQLAVEEDTQEAAGKDRLVGVFVTTEYLDLFDMEAYLNDHASQLLQGGNIIVEPEEKYTRRLWAALVDRGDHQTYEFPDVEGILMLSCEIGGENPYWSSEIGEGFSDVSIHHTATDEGGRLGLSGTVYLNQGSGHTVYYQNPVFQAPDGRVYTVPGSGTGMDGAMGGSFTSTLSEEATVTRNNVTETWLSEITVKMDYVELGSRVEISQFDSQHRLLSTLSCVPGELPEELELLPDTAYVIGEEVLPSGTRRSLYQPGDNRLTAFCLLRDNICIQDGTKLLWPEE